MDEIEPGAPEVPETISVPQRHAVRTVLLDGVLVEWPEGEPMPGASDRSPTPDSAIGDPIVAKGPDASPNHDPAEQE